MIAAALGALPLMLSLVLISSAGLAMGCLYMKFISRDELGERGFNQFYLYAVALGCGFCGFALFSRALSP